MNSKIYALLILIDSFSRNVCIQQAFPNGKPLNTFWFSHKDFAKGGTLKLILGKNPNKEWRISK